MTAAWPGEMGVVVIGSTTTRMIRWVCGGCGVEAANPMAPMSPKLAAMLIPPTMIRAPVAGRSRRPSARLLGDVIVILVFLFLFGFVRLVVFSLL